MERCDFEMSLFSSSFAISRITRYFERLFFGDERRRVEERENEGRIKHAVFRLLSSSARVCLRDYNGGSWFICLDTYARQWLIRRSCTRARNLQMCVHSRTRSFLPQTSFSLRPISVARLGLKQIDLMSSWALTLKGDDLANILRIPERRLVQLFAGPSSPCFHYNDDFALLFLPPSFSFLNSPSLVVSLVRLMSKVV